MRKMKIKPYIMSISQVHDEVFKLTTGCTIHVSFESVCMLPIMQVVAQTGCHVVYMHLNESTETNTARTQWSDLNFFPFPPLPNLSLLSFQAVCVWCMVVGVLEVEVRWRCSSDGGYSLHRYSGLQSAWIMRLPASQVYPVYVSPPPNPQQELKPRIYIMFRSLITKQCYFSMWEI